MKRQPNPFPRASCDPAVQRRGVTFAALPFAVIARSYTSVPHAQLHPALDKPAGSYAFVRARGLAANKKIIKKSFFISILNVR